jgi:hypothetical protein
MNWEQQTSDYQFLNNPSSEHVHDDDNHEPIQLDEVVFA